MRHRLAVLLVGLVTAGFIFAATPATPADPSLASILNFEVAQPGVYPAGWSGGPRETNFVEREIVHSGRAAARIERSPSSEGAFSSLTRSVPMDFTGHRVELRGWIRTEGVTEFAGLWLREDGPAGMLQFDNMQSRGLHGTTGWTEYSVSLPLETGARNLFFGFLVAGSGKGWVDDLQLLVDGKPVWEAPKTPRTETALDRDHEFDAGSRLQITALTPEQIAHLATLGRVWGFLKYHHPRVTGGALHWDYELFRIAPVVLSAPDRSTANAALVAWIDRLGPLVAGARPPLESTALALRPDLAWIDDRAALGPALSERLHAILAAASTGQFYVSLTPNVGNPVFENELAYDALKLPDPGYQLLALFRYWNIVRYWSPYRDLISDNWDAVLTEFIPRVALAANADDYQLHLLALIARVSDTHANLWSSLHLRPPVGDACLPAILRFVENRLVVTAVPEAGDPARTLMQRGDVILAIDDTPVPDLVRRHVPYYAASNEPTRLRDIARTITRGQPGPVKLQLERAGVPREVTASRVPERTLPEQPFAHDLPGPAFRLLSPKVAYLKLSAVKPADIHDYLRQATGTEGWIIDIRNYPAAFVVFALGNLFVEHRTEFARFSVGDLHHPGAFAFTDPIAVGEKAPIPTADVGPTKPKVLDIPVFKTPAAAEPLLWPSPAKAAYAGKVVVLVDEVSQSNAEYTTMAFRAAPRAIVVGSTTAGADGNVSNIPLPGGLRTMISGIGVFYPDKRPTQRIGIVPDIVAVPTIAGIRAGRDEVLEVALRQILGPDVSAETITRLASPQR